jgi:hypothetical protein
VSERLSRQVEAERRRRTPRGVERGEHLRVVRGIDDDEHVAEVLRGRAHHARPADVDLLDEIVERHVGLRRGLHERVEVHDDEIDEADAVRPGGLEVLGVRATREDAAVHQRVQRLHAAVHHLGKLRDVGDVGHGETGLGERSRGAAGGDEFEAAGSEAGGQVNQSGLVGNAQQGSWHSGKYEERVR